MKIRDITEALNTPAERLIKRIRAMHLPGGHFDLIASNNHTVILESLDADEFRSGWGTRVMRVLIDLADAERVELMLKAQSPFEYGDSDRDAEAMNQEALEAWYQRFGFSYYPDPSRTDGMEYSEYMRRMPQ